MLVCQGEKGGVFRAIIGKLISQSLCNIIMCDLIGVLLVAMLESTAHALCGNKGLVKSNRLK